MHVGNINYGDRENVTALAIT